MSAGLAPLDALALVRNVLQGLQSWLDVDVRGTPQPQLPRTYVAHWQAQLTVVLALIEGQRRCGEACPRRGREQAP
jgi:hypothetical protein